MNSRTKVILSVGVLAGMIILLVALSVVKMCIRDRYCNVRVSDLCADKTRKVLMNGEWRNEH